MWGTDANIHIQGGRCVHVCMCTHEYAHMSVCMYVLSDTDLLLPLSVREEKFVDLVQRRELVLPNFWRMFGRGQSWMD